MSAAPELSSRIDAARTKCERNLLVATGGSPVVFWLTGEPPVATKRTGPSSRQEQDGGPRCQSWSSLPAHLLGRLADAQPAGHLLEQLQLFGLRAVQMLALGDQFETVVAG